MSDSTKERQEALAAANSSASNYVYIASEESAWLPARVLEMTLDNKAVVSLPLYKSEAKIQSDGGQSALQFQKQTVDLQQYANHTLPLQNVDEHGQLKQVEDMVDLPFLHEAAILYNLKSRHMQGKPYTRTGDIVIACNPYQWLHDLYSAANRRHYANALVWKYQPTLPPTIAPHIYEVSAAAYRGLAIDGLNQSILVSGESGAGKTESVKICLHHIASVQAGTAGLEEEAPSSKAKSAAPQTNSTTSSISPIVQRVLDSNPLLEAFGNAQTVRNDNSSRFGKYIQLQFDVEDPVQAVYANHGLPSCVLAGSKCDVYLLEKSRVVDHEDVERTYHIFYQLLAAPEDEKVAIWEGLANTSQESFCFVGPSDLDRIEGQTDGDRFRKTIESLALIGVEGDKLQTLLRAICIVLQLGNITLAANPDDDSQSIITSTDELDRLAQLMGVAGEQLQAAVTIRTMRARNEEFKVPLNATQAKDSCNAFAKEIYAKTFLWLVRAINDATCAENNYSNPTSTTGFGSIGLLDIFGFESFETNRFEQLCINYANEKLQQKFTQDIFRSVQQEYELEGIELGEIKYDDNTPVLDLVEGRLGLLAVLNEECVRPGGSDQAFVSKIAKMNKDSPCLFRGKFFGPYAFGVQHYAGSVVYDAQGFVQKNNDTLPQDLQECATASSNLILSTALTNDSMMNTPKNASVSGTVPPSPPVPTRKAPGPPRRGRGGVGAKKGGALVGSTVWTKFKGQLTQLMTNLGQTRTRYIRCIKPNQQKQPFVMQHKSTVEQLRCAGVVAAVTISRSAFPNRLEHDIVLDRFKALWINRSEAEVAAKEQPDPSLRTRMLADHLLAAALKSLETTADDVVTRAFVMGHTRAYFRAGALEYMEAQRLTQLGTWAVEIQKTARGFVKRRQFLRIRRAVIALASIIRRAAAVRIWAHQRHSVIQVQCWYRCLAAQRLRVQLRRDYRSTRIQTAWRMVYARAAFRKNRAAAVVMQAMVRGALQRPKYRVELEQMREEAKLENQVLALQRKLEEAERRRVEAEKMAEEKARKAVEEYQEEKKMDGNTPSSTPVRSAQRTESTATTSDTSAATALSARQQQTLMDESGKMLEYLRKEVFKLRSQNAHLRRDFDMLRDNNQRLMDANASAGASFAALNQHAKQLTKTNDKLSGELQQYKQQVQKGGVTAAELKEELKMKQATYVAEIHSRIQYQKALTKVVDLVQDRCRDTRLVEDILRVADECDSSFMNGPTGMRSPSFFRSPSPGKGTLMSNIRSFWS